MLNDCFSKSPKVCHKGLEQTLASNKVEQYNYAFLVQLFQVFGLFTKYEYQYHILLYFKILLSKNRVKI